MNQFELASLAWGPLVQSAAQHHLLTYQDLTQPLGLRGARPVRFALGLIQSLCLEKRLPPLTSIVINKHTKLPGLGFIAWTGDLQEAHDSVFAFDWSSVPAPFPAATLTRRSSVFSKRSTKPDPKYKSLRLDRQYSGNALAQFVTTQTRRSVRSSRRGYEPGTEFLEWSLEHRAYRRV
jgi:hypothetical protein